MLFSMLCCSNPFEWKEDDDNDGRTQNTVMQRILEGILLHRLTQPMGHVNIASLHCAFHITMHGLWCLASTYGVQEGMLLACV